MDESQKVVNKRGNGFPSFLFGVILTSLLFFTVSFLYFKSKPKDILTASPNSDSTEFISQPHVEAKPSPIERIQEKIKQGSLPAKELTPIQVSPAQPYGEKITAIRTLSKEFAFSSEVDFQAGSLASEERTNKNSYEAAYKLSIHEPKPALTLEEIKKGTPNLPKQLRHLPLLLENAAIHPYWQKLYRLKKQKTVNNAHHLLKLLTKHNYYDCQTFLNVQHPVSKRRAVILQADMDVVADGSDGDRLPQMPEEIVTSTHYQPTTSYSWEKQTETPNPLVAGYRQRILSAESELASLNTSRDRTSWLKGRIKMLQTGIREMESRSFLIAEYDPFIVLPVPVIVSKDPYSPNVGDYAIVFHKDKIYPAIVGDAGPDYKVGEASLRIARQVNPKASPYYRAVSDVNVTYLVFPGTRKKPFAAPNYTEIHQECLRLIKDLGGLEDSTKLHVWEDLFPPIEAAATLDDLSERVTE